MDTNAADAVVSEVDRLLAAAYAEASSYTDPGSQIVYQLDHTLAPAIFEWKTTRREWATAGGHLVAGDYTWERWAAEGRDYAQIAAGFADVAADYGVFDGLIFTIKETGKDLAHLGDSIAPLLPTAWPWWAWVLVGLAVLGYAGNAFAKVRA